MRLPVVFPKVNPKSGHGFSRINTDRSKLGLSGPPPKSGPPALLFVDFAVLHYELDIFQQANVGEGISGYGDDVGVLSRLD